MLRSYGPSGAANLACAFFACITLFFLYTRWSPHAGLQFRAPASSSQIPRILWYKLGSSGLSPESQQWISTCTDRNPGYTSRFLTDESADYYVRRAFKEHADVVDTYLQLKIPILKADLLRYLLLFDQGGIWSDLDVSCEETPIDEWIPAEFREKANLVVGWEFDVGWDWEFKRQFQTWTIMAKPGLPHISSIINDTTWSLRNKAAEHEVSVDRLDLKMIGDVAEMTGQKRFTSGVFRYLETVLGKIHMEPLYRITQPVMISDVLIMPGYSFANSTNKYANREGLGPVLVNHHYSWSWKGGEGGEPQPERLEE
jgi:mannosyltransferase OCH1-like enzyme